MGKKPVEWERIDNRSMGIYDFPDPTGFLAGEAGELTTFSSQWGQTFVELPGPRSMRSLAFQQESE